MPGAQCTRSLVWVEITTRVSHHRSTGITRHSRTRWLTAYIVFSPELGLFGLRRLADSSAKLGASVEASGPHDFAVRLPRPRQKRSSRPPHPAPRFVTLRNAPLWGGTRRI